MWRKSLISMHTWPTAHALSIQLMHLPTEEMCTFLCLHIKSCWLRREVCNHSKYNPLPKVWQQLTIERCFTAHHAGKSDRACLLGVYMAELLRRGGCSTATAELLLGNFSVQTELLLRDSMQLEAMLLAACWKLWSQCELQEPLGLESKKKTSVAAISY